MSHVKPTSESDRKLSKKHLKESIKFNKEHAKDHMKAMKEARKRYASVSRS